MVRKIKKPYVTYKGNKNIEKKWAKEEKEKNETSTGFPMTESGKEKSVSGKTARVSFEGDTAVGDADWLNSLDADLVKVGKMETEESEIGKDDNKIGNHKAPARGKKGRQKKSATLRLHSKVKEDEKVKTYIEETDEESDPFSEEEITNKDQPSNDDKQNLKANVKGKGNIRNRKKIQEDADSCENKKTGKKGLKNTIEDKKEKKRQGKDVGSDVKNEEKKGLRRGNRRTKKSEEVCCEDENVEEKKGNKVQEKQRKGVATGRESKVKEYGKKETKKCEDVKMLEDNEDDEESVEKHETRFEVQDNVCGFGIEIGQNEDGKKQGRNSNEKTVINNNEIVDEIKTSLVDESVEMPSELDDTLEKEPTNKEKKIQLKSKGGRRNSKDAGADIDTEGIIDGSEEKEKVQPKGKTGRRGRESKVAGADIDTEGIIDGSEEKVQPKGKTGRRGRKSKVAAKVDEDSVERTEEMTYVKSEVVTTKRGRQSRATLELITGKRQSNSSESSSGLSSDQMKDDLGVNTESRTVKGRRGRWSKAALELTRGETKSTFTESSADLIADQMEEDLGTNTESQSAAGKGRHRRGRSKVGSKDETGDGEEEEGHVDSENNTENQNNTGRRNSRKRNLPDNSQSSSHVTQASELSSPPKSLIRETSAEDLPQELQTPVKKGKKVREQVISKHGQGTGESDL